MSLIVSSGNEDARVFVPLNSELREVLAALQEYQFEEGFFESLPSIAKDKFGMDEKAVANDIAELEQLGYVRVFRGDEHNGMHIIITSDGRCYDKLLHRHWLATSFGWLGSLVTGASGGLVVFILTMIAH